MDVMVADLVSPASAGSAPDVGTRAVRSTGYSSATVTRRSFSSVLGSVRSEEGVGNTQGTDRVRTSNNGEERSGSVSRKGLTTSTSQTAQSEGSTARASSGDRVNGDPDENSENAPVEIETITSKDDSAAAREESIPTSLVPAIVLQGGTQSASTVVLEIQGGEQRSDREDQSATDSSPTPAMSHLSARGLRPAESPFSGLGVTAPSSDEPEESLTTSIAQKGTETQAKPSGKQGVSKDGNTEGKTTIPVETQSTNPTLASGKTPSASDVEVPRSAHAHEGMMLPAGQSGRSLTTPVSGEDGSEASSRESQARLFVQSYGDQEPNGPRSEELPASGQQVADQRAEQSGQMGPEHDGRQQGNPESKLPQATIADPQGVNGGTTEHYAVVAHGQMASVPPTSPASLSVSPGPAAPAPEVPLHTAASLLRSVVLDVAQPDLGHVNIRVAMMNDFVHTHFSTDRPDVGQFLINGQDRLQTTLQANGLDLGQFRVDIDRHNGGRSFQQGFFQEQGQTGEQGSHGLGKGQLQGRSDDMRPSLPGRLNVVA